MSVCVCVCFFLYYHYCYSPPLSRQHKQTCQAFIAVFCRLLHFVRGCSSSSCSRHSSSCSGFLYFFHSLSFFLSFFLCVSLSFLSEFVFNIFALEVFRGLLFSCFACNQSVFLLFSPFFLLNNIYISIYVFLSYSSVFFYSPLLFFL